MHALLFLVAVPLTLANAGLSPRYALLLPRQGGNSFIPGTYPVNSCPAPSSICGANLCIDVPAGDTCCAEGYGCPAGNFCLTQGYCCPDGDSPVNCASNHGITLSAGFQASNTVPAGAASSTSAILVSTSAVPTITSSASLAATLVPTSAVPTITPSASLAATGTTPAFTSTAKNATGSAPPHATGTGAVTGGVATFTGGAEVVSVGGIGALIGGIVGFILL